MNKDPKKMMVEVSTDNQSPQAGNGFSKWLGRTVLRLMGWNVAGAFPSLPKYIVVLAPHTSNWDFVVGIATLLASRLKVSFLIKHTLFIWPFSAFLHKVGGIPTNREAAHGVVGEMVQHFNQNQRMIVAITPEGTRSSVAAWKKGFVYMAHGANVPVVPISLDYEHRTLTIGEPMILNGEVEADLYSVKAFFNGVRGKRTVINQKRA